MVKQSGTPDLLGTTMADAAMKAVRGGCAANGISATLGGCKTNLAVEWQSYSEV